MNSNTLSLGALHVDRLTMLQTLHRIASLIRGERGGYVVTPNVDHLVIAERDPRLRDAYASAALSIPDGMPLVWMSHWLGQPLPERVAGSDLFDPLMALAARESWPVFLLGSTEPRSREAMRRLMLRHRGLVIAGRDTSRWSPETAGPAERSAAVRAVREQGARIVVVGLGCPKQELWMKHHAEVLGPAVALGLGGVIDMAAGSVSRAPQWMRRSGLEWLYRLNQEPLRLAHRYLVQDMQVLPIFLRELRERTAPQALRPAAASAIPE